MNGLSKQAIRDLRNQFDGDEDEAIRKAGMYVELIRVFLTATDTGTRKEKNRRLKGLKSALSKLTDMDKLNLRLSMSWRFYGITDPNTIQNTFDMLETVIIDELEKPALKNTDRIRKLLIDFARIALRKKWIDAGNNDLVLIDVLESIMREAGVSHDARSIAKKAKKLNQLNP